MIVMKFGGTSVQNSCAIDRVVEIILKKKHKIPIIVSSATSQTTDTLINCAKESADLNSVKAFAILINIYERHINIVNELNLKVIFRDKLLDEIKILIDELSEIIIGISQPSELTPKIFAKVLSFGELLSTKIITYALKNREIDCELIDARNFMISNANFNNAEPIIELINEKVNKHLLPKIKLGKIIITQGFIAATTDGDTTILSRGGSDYSACIIGKAISAEEIEIWTDVDGILTADPKKVPSAKSISELTYTEAAELANSGAKVLHPAAIFPAMEKNIPVRILNSFSPEKSGTLIKAKSEKSDFLVNSITSKSDIIVMNILFPKKLMSQGFLQSIFEVFEKFKTSFYINISSDENINVTLNSDEKIDLIESELSKISTVRVLKDKSIVCVIGSNLQYRSEAAKKIYSALGTCHFTMNFYGESIFNFSFIVDTKELNSILKTLHKVFFEKQQLILDKSKQICYQI
jgi:aspartate kinase